MSTPWSFLSPSTATLPLDAPVLLVPLPGEAVLTVSGPDSQKFLQGQTTTDFREVTPLRSLPGACCNLKGRASVSFRTVLWRDAYHLVMDAGLLEPTLSLLQKYIIFSKAQVAVADVAVLGVLGMDAAHWLQTQFGMVPAQAGDVTDTGSAVLVRLPGESRFLVLVSGAELPALWARLSAGATTGSPHDWRLAQIRAGETQILESTREVFQPQELNLQAMDGISYNKGCYTGQEIVARLYFRGKLKHWAHRFSGETGAVPAPGSYLVDAEGRHAGQVVLATPASATSIELLAVVKDDAVNGLSPEGVGTALQPLPLPYTITIKE